MPHPCRQIGKQDNPSFWKTNHLTWWKEVIYCRTTVDTSGPQSRRQNFKRKSVKPAKVDHGPSKSAGLDWTLQANLEHILNPYLHQSEAACGREVSWATNMHCSISKLWTSQGSSTTSATHGQQMKLLRDHKTSKGNVLRWTVSKVLPGKLKSVTNGCATNLYRRTNDSVTWWLLVRCHELSKNMQIRKGRNACATGPSPGATIIHLMMSLCLCILRARHFKVVTEAWRSWWGLKLVRNLSRLFRCC